MLYSALKTTTFEAVQISDMHVMLVTEIILCVISWNFAIL